MLPQLRRVAPQGRWGVRKTNWVAQVPDASGTLILALEDRSIGGDLRITQEVSDAIDRRERRTELASAFDQHCGRPLLELGLEQGEELCRVDDARHQRRAAFVVEQILALKYPAQT